MSERRHIDVMELRPMHAGQMVDFHTLAGRGMHYAGLGEWGSWVPIHGELVTVTNSRTSDRAWPKVTVMAEVIIRRTAQRVRIDALLDPRCTLTLTGEPGFARDAHLVLLDEPFAYGDLTFAPGVYRAVPLDSPPGRFALRFRGATYPLPNRPGA